MRNNVTGQLDGAITPDGIYKLVRAYSAELGFEIGAHSLRATAPPHGSTITAARGPRTARLLRLRIDGFRTQTALLHRSANGLHYPQPNVTYAIRMESGRPNSSMRFITCTATVTSVARRSSSRKRSPSPITCL